jgi:spore germination cell wall hydrolase CwlJ-like protein
LKAIALAIALLIAAQAVTANSSIFTEEQCMSSAIYYEARSESIAGKKAVQEVILNRANAQGKTICQVVRARAQFSWFPWKRIRKFDEEMQKLLTEVNESPKILNDDRYMYFYSSKIKPIWAMKMKCRKIDSQRFCRSKE